MTKTASRGRPEDRPNPIPAHVTADVKEEAAAELYKGQWRIKRSRQILEMADAGKEANSLTRHLDYLNAYIADLLRHTLDA